MSAAADGTFQPPLAAEEEAAAAAGGEGAADVDAVDADGGRFDGERARRV